MPRNGNTSGHKSDKGTFEKRVRAVQEWILQGYSSSDIRTTIITSWTVGERQAAKYYKAAFERFEEENRKDMSKKTAMHIARREKLFRDLNDKTSPDGVRAALRLLDSTAKIEGVLSTIRLSVNQTNSNQNQLTSENTFFDNKKQYQSNIEIISKIKQIESNI